MALYLIYRTKEHDRNSQGVHAVLAEGADEAAARTAAQASVPNGEVKVSASWAAVDLGAGALPSRPIFFEGDAISLLGVSRGGNRI